MELKTIYYIQRDEVLSGKCITLWQLRVRETKQYYIVETSNNLHGYGGGVDFRDRKRISKTSKYVTLNYDDGVLLFNKIIENRSRKLESLQYHLSTLTITTTKKLEYDSPYGSPVIIFSSWKKDDDPKEVEWIEDIDSLTVLEYEEQLIITKKNGDSWDVFLDDQDIPEVINPQELQKILNYRLDNKLKIDLMDWDEMNLGYENIKSVKWK